MFHKLKAISSHRVYATASVPIMPQCQPPQSNPNLICCIGVCPSLQHDETHWGAPLGFFTHQLENMCALCTHIVDICLALQCHLQAAGVLLGGVNTVEQYT